MGETDEIELVQQKAIKMMKEDGACGAQRNGTEPDLFILEKAGSREDTAVPSAIV